MRSYHDLITTAHKLREYIEVNAKDLTDEQALELPSAFPNWSSNQDYTTGDRVRYGDKLYKCVQSHHAQADWSPDKVPALWTEITPEGIIPEWKQPTGAQDAYMIGDKVRFEGHVYVSTVDYNVWAPDVTGWDLVI